MKNFEQAALNELKVKHEDLLKKISENKELTEDINEKLKVFFTSFLKQFTAKNEAA